MKIFSYFPISPRAVAAINPNIERQPVCYTSVYHTSLSYPIANTIIALLITFLLTTLLTACDSSDVSGGGGGNSGTPKNIPQNITINPGTRIIELAWSGVSGSSGYNVYWSNEAGVNKAQREVIHTALPYLQHQNLSNGQPYYYVVTAYTSNGESQESVEVSATPIVAPPTTPSAVNTHSGNARITLSWDTIPGATRYTLYWNTQGNVSHTDARIDRVVSPFVHSDLSNDQNYHYILVAENAAGPSSASTEVSARPQMPTPSAPIITQLTTDSGQVSLHWLNVSNASNYTLYWNTSGDVSTEDIAIAQVTSPYTIPLLTKVHLNMDSLDDTVSYYYRLQAHNTGGDSPLSNQAHVTPPHNHSISPPGTLPNTPVAVNVTLGNGQLTLNWPAVEGAIGYNLYWSANASGEIIPGAAGVEKLTHLQTPYTHIALNNGQTYHYRLSAFNHHGESALSTNVNGVPQMIIPGVPARVHAISGDERIAVRWNDVEAASGYTLYLDNQQGDNRAIPNVSSPYEVKGLSNNTSYDIHVTAHNAQNESERSTLITATPHEPVPNAPQQLTAQPGSNQVVLQWDSALVQDPNDSAQRIRGYRVYYDTQLGIKPDNSTLLKEIDSDADSGQNKDGRWQFKHTGLKNGQRYYYVVIAFNDGGESGASAEVWARPEVPIPDAPSQVWAEAGNNQVVIHFTEADSSATPTYNLYWNKQQIDGVSDTRVITNIQPGHPFSEGVNTNGNTYHFQVSAFNAGDESKLSPVVSASPQAPPPARPSKDLQTSIQPGQVTLSWSPVGDASGYIIYWSTNPDIDPNTSAQLTGNEVQPGYQHTSLVNGQTYYYQITAVNPGGESAASETLMAKPQINPPTTPSPPSLSPGDASVRVDFQTVNNATSYTLFWHTNPTANTGQWSKKHGIQTGDGLNHLTNGQTYYFKLAANNAGGQSAPSTSSSITPQAPVPSTPSGVSAIAGNGQISLNWHTNPNVSYTLHWSDDATIEPINSGNLFNNVRPSYTHTGLSNNTVYTYQLTARNSSGDSPPTSVITATPITQGPTPVNQAPQISEGDKVNVTMDEDSNPIPFSLRLTASDADDDPLSWSLNKAPTQGTASVLGNNSTNTASIDYTPKENYYGTDSFAIQVSDDRGGVDVISVDVTIETRNDAPVITSANTATVEENTTAIMMVTATDADDDTLTYTLSDGADKTFFGIDYNSGALAFIAAPDFEAPADADGDNVYQVAVSVSDGNFSVPHEISVSVNPATVTLAGLFANANLQRCVDEGTWVYAYEVIHLNCEGYNISDLSGIERLTNLQTLNLRGSKLANLNSLAGANFSSLTELNFGFSQLTDISGLTNAGLSNLNTLNLGGNALTNLNNFEGADLSSLTHLDLRFNLLTDISGLASAGLGNLKTLYLSSNNLANLNDLAGANLSNLTNLYLGGNQLTDISWLASAGLSNLKTLHLNHTNLANLNGLAGANLSSLTELRLEDNQLTDIGGLASAGLNNLLTLELSRNKLASLNGLAGANLNSLTDLYLSYNQLTDLSGLTSAELSNLKTLYLYQNNLENLNGLARGDFSSLTELRLEDNQLTDIGGLASAGLNSLLILELSRNKLASLNGLAGGDLSSLVRLHLGNNQLIDISGLSSAGLNNLLTLELFGNKLASFNGLTKANLSSLTELDLGFNQLTDISWLASAGLSNLKKLNLSRNNLANLNGLAGSNLSNMTELRLSGNQLTDISWMAGANLSRLTELQLSGNQLTDISGLSSAGLNNLLTLELHSNKLSSLSGLEGANLSSLTKLLLHNNHLTDISGLGSAGFSNLLTLELSSNKLGSLNSLAGVNISSLTSLNLSINQLTDLSGLASAELSNLKSLRLTSNRLANLNSLAEASLSSLISLYLRYNQLTDINGLASAGLTNLGLLYLDNNDITDVSAAANLTTLSVLDLHNNSIGGLGVGRVYSLATLTKASSITLRNNLDMSCTEMQSLINSLGVDIVSPSTAEEGTNCTAP